MKKLAGLFNPTAPNTLTPIDGRAFAQPPPTPPDGIDRNYLLILPVSPLKAHLKAFCGALHSPSFSCDLHKINTSEVPKAHINANQIHVTVPPSMDIKKLLVEVVGWVTKVPFGERVAFCRGAEVKSGKEGPDGVTELWVTAWGSTTYLQACYPQPENTGRK